MSDEVVPPTGPLGGPVPSTVHEARGMLPQLVKAAGAGRSTPLTRKSEGREHRALLVSPAAAEEAGCDLAAAPAWPTAEARKKLGELVQAAANGSPQVLRRHKTPVAVLIPHTTPAPATEPATLADTDTDAPASTCDGQLPFTTPDAAPAQDTSPSLGPQALGLADELREVVEHRAILCVTGPDPTTAQAVIAACQATHGLTTMWLRPEPAKDRGSLVRALYTELALDQRRPRPRALADAQDLIAAELQRRARLVVVPDAHRLRTEALELLYALWAHRAPNYFPLVLTGDDRLDSVLKRRALADLNSCVLIRHHLPPAPASTALEGTAPDPRAAEQPTIDHILTAAPAHAPQGQLPPTTAPGTHTAAAPGNASAAVVPVADADTVPPAATPTMSTASAVPAPGPHTTATAGPDTTAASSGMAPAASADAVPASAPGPGAQAPAVPSGPPPAPTAPHTAPGTATAPPPGPPTPTAAPAGPNTPAAPAATEAEPTAAAAPPRRHLAPLAEALAALPTTTGTDATNPDTEATPALPGLPTGITALDQALGGLQPGRFHLVAGAPGAGTSLLATAAARTTAVTGNLPVLYAASGLTSADVLTRVIAAHTPVDYRRLRAGTLDPNERQAVAATTQLFTNAPLFIDDGTDLDTTAIASTVPDVPHLALLVVDRLQAAHDPRLPLSGRAAIKDAVQALAHLARTRHLPVLAALDTDEPALLKALAADLTLTLTRDGSRVQLTIKERDLGDLADVALTADLAHARLTDYVEFDPYDGIKPLTPAELDAIMPFPHTDAYSNTSRTPRFDPAHAFSGDQGRQVTADLAAAVRPFLDQPDALEQLPPDLRDVLPTLVRLLDTLAAGNQWNGSSLSAFQEAVTGAAARRPRLPDTAPSRHLQAALDAFYTHARAHGYTPPADAPTSPPAATAHPPQAPKAPPAAAENDISAPQPSAATSAPAAARPARPGAPRSSTYVGRDYSHFTQMISTAVERALQEHGGDTEAATDALIKQAIPNGMALFEATRVGGNYEHTVYPETLEFLRKKTRDGADEIWEGRHKWDNAQIIDAIGRGTLTDLTVTVLDTNASYLSAFKTHLPIGALQHNPGGGFDPKRSGIYRLPDRPAWNHTDLPDPIGNRHEQGPVLLDDATIRLLIRCAKLGLCDPPHITESWTSGATEGLLEKFRRVLTQARETAILNDDDVTLEYIKAMYSKFVSTIGESSVNRDIRRPDWMHIIRSQAFANLWYKAHRAHKNGLTIVRLRGTDELHIIASDTDWRTVFNEGRLTTELKTKDQYTLPRSKKNAR